MAQTNVLSRKESDITKCKDQTKWVKLQDGNTCNNEQSYEREWVFFVALAKYKQNFSWNSQLQHKSLVGCCDNSCVQLYSSLNSLQPSLAPIYDQEVTVQNWAHQCTLYKTINRWIKYWITRKIIDVNDGMFVSVNSSYYIKSKQWQLEVFAEGLSHLMYDVLGRLRSVLKEFLLLLHVRHEFFQLRFERMLTVKVNILRI